MKFGTEKLEGCGYPAVKKIEDMITRFDGIYERDGRTDRHRQAAIMHSIARQKSTVYVCLTDRRIRCK